jgi:hypothetical protein
MALTLDVEQKLTSIGLVQYFDTHRLSLLTAATEAYNYVRKNFPDGAQVRTDDIAKALQPIMEVNQGLKRHLAARKATQKYWYKHFTDLILDRTWDEITNQGNDEEANHDEAAEG